MGTFFRFPVRLTFIFLIFLYMTQLSSCVYVANRFAVPKSFEEVEVLQAALNKESGPNLLNIMSWNIGYAGMGKDSDFILDKGSQYRPPSKRLVIENLAAIKTYLTSSNTDIIMLQEVSKRSWSTYQLNVHDAIKQSFPNYDWTYSDDIRTRWLAWPLTTRMGNATISRIPLLSAETRALPLEPGFFLGVFRKEYKMHIVRLHQEVEWIFINLHLSAFDSSKDSIREQQLQTVMAFAKEEYAKGNHVVLGGDWNLRLTPTEFPHKTPQEHLFWIRDLPPKTAPEGWQWAIDPNVPTVRTANQPYREGENHVLIIDGFLVSPNVEVLSVHTDDLRFEHTDHHPVIISVRAKE
jgi:endonuclease/exonuclease/phosphatase family metal-dependent hydrolase